MGAPAVAGRCTARGMLMQSEQAADGDAAAHAPRLSFSSHMLPALPSFPSAATAWRRMRGQACWWTRSGSKRCCWMCSPTR